MVLGVPGLICCYFLLKLSNPVRGINDPMSSKLLSTSSSSSSSSSSGDENTAGESSNTIAPMNIEDPSRGSNASPNASTPTNWREYSEILSNKPYMLCVMGLAANNYCVGGLVGKCVCDVM